MRNLLTGWRTGLYLVFLAVVPMPGVALAETPAQPPAAQASPAPGATDTPRAGRYTMVPAEGGFVRLDTQTGTVSHCRRGEASGNSVWSCVTITEEVLSKPDPAAALGARVDQLERQVADLTARLKQVEAPANPSTSAAPTGDPELDRALNFSQELMSRFFGMVREMKREVDDNKT